MAAVMIAGCGSHPRANESTLRFHRLDEGADTTGISRGKALLQAFDVNRDPTGALRASGRLDLPDDTMLELIVYAPGGAQVLARSEFPLEGRHFESPPILGQGGPLPTGHYHFQLRCRFDPDVQPPAVMQAVANGGKLRGPGIIRIHSGMVAFVHDLETRR